MTARDAAPLLLFAFDTFSPSHLTAGSWAQPGDEGDRYADLAYWTGLARMLEQARFDGVFLADTLGYHDVFGGTAAAALRDAAQIPICDPLMVVSGMAAATEHLGFAVTASTTYEHPYLLARRLSTLDHLTAGRIGWNVVTSYAESAARNLGLNGQIPHDRRYDMAEEYLQVCYKLWEASWDDDAVVRHPDLGTYTDPAKVRGIAHRGGFYDVPGFGLCAPSPQRTPLLCQAGASPRGLAFAGAHAEMVFVDANCAEQAGRKVAALRRAVGAAGRDPRSVKVLALLTVIVAATDEQAHAKHERHRAAVNHAGALARFGGWTGVDLSRHPLDTPLAERTGVDGVQSVLDMFTRADPTRTWTPREIAGFLGVGGTGAVVVGSPATVADELARWRDVADLDGVNLGYATKPGTWRDVIEFALPELRRRGLARTDYDPPGTTLREAVLGRGHRRTCDDHPASAVRRPAGAPVPVGGA